MTSSKKTVIVFFALFLLVYFLESIGGFYMTSAVVSIEKQFQITSRMSGLMVSAGDFGYIPTVVFVSYFGGKGNRARWIGAGCLLIAFANVLISLSHFAFPVNPTRLNFSYVETNLALDSSRLDRTTSLDTFVTYLMFLPNRPNISEIDYVFPAIDRNKSLSSYAKEILLRCNTNPSDMICNSYQNYLWQTNFPSKEEVSEIRTFTGLPFAVCSTVINALRNQIEILRCSKTISNMGPFLMIFGGLLLLGVGRTMPFSLGLPLIDDNVRKKNLPLYFAGMFFIRILGPVLGLFIGSITNKYYYTSDAPPGLTPRDPMWIGRWWAGFMLVGFALFLPSLGLFLFPSFMKRDPTTVEEESKNGEEKSELLEMQIIEKGDQEKKTLDMENRKPNDNSQTTPKKEHKRNRSLALVDRNLKNGDHTKDLSPIEKAKDFCNTVQTILKSPVYVGALVGRILDVLAFKGFFVFLPKYLEIQFGVPQYRINRMMGIIGVAGFAIGSVGGSVVMRRFKLQGRKAAAWVAVCSAVAACQTFMNSRVGCRSVLTSLVSCQKGQNCLQFTSTCNAECDCAGVPLYPVCNTRGEPFYSPCHAGCTYTEGLGFDNSTKVFYECGCSGTEDRTVSRDFCFQAECEKKFVYYFINMSISGIFAGLSVVPAILIVLRSVPKLHRSVSLGFQGLLVSLLATLPSPVFWGWIIDTTCVMWNNVCGDPTTGACVIYNADKLRVRLHITYGCLRVISLASDIWVCYHAKDLKLLDEEPDEDDIAFEIKGVEETAIEG